MNPKPATAQRRLGLLLAIAMIFLSHQISFADNVVFNAADLSQTGLSPVTATRLETQPRFPYEISGTNIITRQSVRTQFTNGTVTVSNLVAGVYTNTIKGTGATTTFLIEVAESGTDNTVDAVDLITLSTNAPGSSTAYSKSQSDSRFVRSTNGTSYSLTASNTTLLGTVTFGGETRTNWPTGGSGGGDVTTAQLTAATNSVTTNLQATLVGTNRFETNATAVTASLASKAPLLSPVFLTSLTLTNSSTNATNSVWTLDGDGVPDEVNFIKYSGVARSFSIGRNNQSGTDEEQITIGNGNINVSEDGHIFGENSTVTNNAKIAIGYDVDIDGLWSVGIGTHLRGTGEYTWTIGESASVTNATNAWVIGRNITNSVSDKIDIGLTEASKLTIGTNGATFRLGLTNLMLSTNTLVGTSANGKDLVSITLGSGLTRTGNEISVSNTFMTLANTNFDSLFVTNGIKAKQLIISNTNGATPGIIITNGGITVLGGISYFDQGLIALSSNTTYFAGGLINVYKDGSMTWANDLAGVSTNGVWRGSGAELTNIPIASVVGQTATNSGFQSRIAANETAIPLKQTGSTKLSNIVALADSPGVLTNDGSGNLSWVAVAGGSGGGGGTTFSGFLDITTAPYSAVGDGTTDNYSAITNALAVAATSNLVVWIPGGDFKIGTILTNVRASIFGAGRKSRLLFPTNVTGTMMTVTTTNISLKDFWLDGQETNNFGVVAATNGTRNGIYHYSDGFATVTRLYVSGFNNAGLIIGGSSTINQDTCNTFYDENWFVKCGRGITNGVQNGEYTQIKGNRFINCGLAIETHAANQLVRGNFVTSCYAGGWWQGDGSARGHNKWLENTFNHMNGTAMTITNVSTSGVFAMNSFYSSGNANLFVKRCNGINVFGNVGDTLGIEVDDGASATSTGILVHDNMGVARTVDYTAKQMIHWANYDATGKLADNSGGQNFAAGGFGQTTNQVWGVNQSTNTVGSSQVGQIKIMVNGVAYYLDLKQ